MKIIILVDPKTAGERCAALLAREARMSIAVRGHFCLALSGGKTPWVMMRALATETLSWPDIQVFQTDERIVSLGSPDRSLTQLREALFSRVPLRPEHVHPMPVEDGDLAAAARRYGELLERCAGAPAVLDIVQLGLGTDGHTASLVPGDPVLEVVDSDVALTGSYQGHHRMTLTYQIINRARMTVWLVIGEEKARILRRFCEGDANIPAGRVRSDRATVFADMAAARLLQKDMYEDDDEAS